MIIASIIARYTIYVDVGHGRNMVNIIPYVFTLEKIASMGRLGSISLYSQNTIQFSLLHHRHSKIHKRKTQMKVLSLTDFLGIY